MFRARGRCLTTAAATVIAVVATSASSAEASAVKSFLPVARSQRALEFAPRGIQAPAVRRAYVRYVSRRQRQVRQGVSASRVRRAVRRHSRLRVTTRRSSSSTGALGRLVVRTAAAPRSPSTGGDGYVGGTACTYGTFSSSNLPGACWRPYSDSSPFNTPLSSSAADAGSSSAIVDRTTSFGAGGPKFYGGVSGTPEDWYHPIYYSQPSDPVFTVHCTEHWGPCAVEGMQVRIPDAAQPAAGGDGHLAVIDQQDGWEYDFWQVRSKPSGGGTLTVSYGGRTRIGTPDATGLGSNATAAFFGVAAGVIRPEELAAGHIDHALFMVVKCTNGHSVAPAAPGTTGRVCSQIGLPNADAPAMGQHFYLDMSQAQIDALNVPDWQKTILRAMAQYGMYVGDTGADHDGWSLQIESGSSYTSFGHPDPWVTLGKQLGLPIWNNGSTKEYMFDMSHAVDWQSALRVAAPTGA